MEERSLLYLVTRDVAIISGFLIAAAVMLVGIIDYQTVMGRANTPQRRASATFFLVVFTFYFITFVVLAIVQGIQTCRLLSRPPKIAPLDLDDVQPQP